MSELFDPKKRPDLSSYYPEKLWSEIDSGLWVGGTDSFDEVFNLAPKGADVGISKKNFDTVVTMYAWSRPVDWMVKELRFGIYDDDMTETDIEALHDLVNLAHKDWKSGKRVLVRCQAGINRSSLVAALILIRDGLSARDAIDLIRAKRAQACLKNSHFETWLLGLDPKQWRA